MTGGSRTAGLSRSLRIFAFALRATAVVLYISWLQQARGPEASQDRANAAYRDLARRFRLLAERLQGLLIKVGQFLSTRVDFLPEAVTSELARLQDTVPAAVWEDVRAQIEDELRMPLEQAFPVFEQQPLAAASFGQVHLATLADGSPVAVKVLRPGIEGLVATDLAAIRVVMRALDRFTTIGRRLDLPVIYREFRATVLEELDYEQEARNLLQFRANFAGDATILVPRLYESLSTRRVLVMERVDGIKVNDKEALLVQGISPSQVAEDLIATYFKQVMVDGFYHADPHPGNVFVRKGEGRPILVYLDFGMMGRLDEDARRAMRVLVQGVILRDMDAVVQALDDLGFLRPHADRRTLKRGLRYAIDQLSGGEVTKPGSPEYYRFLAEMRDFLYTEPFQLPATFTFLGRAIGIVVGMVTGLEPGFDFMGVLRSRAPQFLSDGAGGQEGDPLAVLSKGLRRILDELAPSAWALLRLPQELERHLQQQAASTAPHAERANQPVLAAGLVVAGALLWNASHPWLAVAAWVGAWLLGRPAGQPTRKRAWE